MLYLTRLLLPSIRLGIQPLVGLGQHAQAPVAVDGCRVQLEFHSYPPDGRVADVAYSLEFGPSARFKSAAEGPEKKSE